MTALQIDADEVMVTLGAELGKPDRTWAVRSALWVALYCVLGLFSTGARAETTTIPVFVSILPLKHFVERVGGEQVRATVMVGPGQNPHTYEPSPKQVVALAEAKLFFRIGASFEDAWMARIVAANPMLRVVDVREGVVLREFSEETAHAHSHGEGIEALPEWIDPHIWTDPRRVKVIAGNIRQALIAVDPVHRSVYDSNYAEFIDELDRLDAAIRGLLEGKKVRRFMVFHPAWGYFADAYGLLQIAIELAGKEPGARGLARLIDEAKAQGIRVIFVQPQFSRRHAQTIAQAIGGKVVAVDPLAENYAENLLLVANSIAEAVE